MNVPLERKQERKQERKRKSKGESEKLGENSVKRWGEQEGRRNENKKQEGKGSSYR